jgi:hypothetical protein
MFKGDADAKNLIVLRLFEIISTVLPKGGESHMFNMQLPKSLPD